VKLLAPWFAAESSDTLNGRTVTLRFPEMDDFEDWAELRSASRKFLEPWEPLWDESAFSRASFRNRIRRYRSLAEDDSAYPYFIFATSTNKLVGGLTLSNVRRGVAQMASLGYWIGQPYARQGYMTDAIQALLPHTFQNLGLHRVEAACLPHNEASLRLLKTCGFTQEGLARSYLKIAGRWEDHVLFAKLASDSSVTNGKY
jgi:ribosomal-protein-alanine N-acetyltransferase